MEYIVVGALVGFVIALIAYNRHKKKGKHGSSFPGGGAGTGGGTKNPPGNVEPQE